MRTTDLRSMLSLLVFVGVVASTTLLTLVTPGAVRAQSSSCGPQGRSGSLGCNPAPVTIAFSMPGRDDAVAVTVTLTRGLQQDRNGPPGSSPAVQVRTWDTDPTTP